MIHGLLNRASRYLLQPSQDRYATSNPEITEVIDALDRRLSELRHAIEAEQQARSHGSEDGYVRPAPIGRPY